MTTRWYLVAALALVACGKKESSDKNEPAKGSSAGGAAAPSGNAALPTGPGPHEGFDLAAIHAKLQGSWLVGGAAFSTIPEVWSLDGDQLTTVNAKGKKSTTTLRLLAPCYYFEGKPGGAGSYGKFVFDGDTLYLGLGSAGVVQGSRALACVATGIYDHDGKACSLWRKKPFGDTWTKEGGDCGFSDDKTQFWGDDTKSSRKIYGKETLDVKGGVLLTKQMAGNKAEKMASLDAAIAKQKEKLDAKAALAKTPTDLPFKAWGLEGAAPTLAAGATVWAAGVTRDGKWSLRTFRYKSAEDGAVWLTGMGDSWAPPAFVHPPDAAKVVAGTPALLGIGALMPYGNVDKIDGTKATVRFRSGNKISQQTIELERVLPVAPNQWVFGTPVAYKEGERWEDGRLVHATDADAFVLIGQDVRKLPRTDVRLVDLSKRWSKGAKVWAMPDSGFSPLVFVEGTIEDVIDGALFTIKAGDRKFLQTADRMIAKLP